MNISQRGGYAAVLWGKIRRDFLPYSKKLLSLFSLRKEILASFTRRRELMKQPAREGANLVILLFPAHPCVIAGGLFSILNIAAASRDLLGGDHEVVVAYLPGRFGLGSYPYFPNKEIIFNFSQVMRRFPAPKSLIVHIPECYATGVFRKRDSRETRYLASAQRLRINIMNQNILLMPSPDAIAHLSALTSDFTQTTAHASYCTQDNADKWNTPMLHLSAPFWKDYPYIPYMLKRDWIAYSPDNNPMAETILSGLRKRLPHFKFIKINGVLYKRYLEIISKSKYVISFGEGFDGFFFEPYYCGTIGSTARNELFFSDKMENWHMLYHSFQDMNDHISEDIVKYENDPSSYIAYSNQKRSELHAGIDEYWNYFKIKLDNFYQMKYDYLPDE